MSQILFKAQSLTHTYKGEILESRYYLCYECEQKSPYKKRAYKI